MTESGSEKQFKGIVSEVWKKIMAGLMHVSGSSAALALNTPLANKHNNQHSINAIHTLSELCPGHYLSLLRGLRNVTEGV